LRAACDVARPFKGRIRLLMPIVISFPAQLNDPPASYRHLVWAFQSMAGADVDRLQVSMWPCRDARAVLAANLPRRSTVIVGLKGFWDLRARRLARWLAVQGHRVLLAYPQARPSDKKVMKN
jgi:hypothetical protein